MEPVLIVDDQHDILSFIEWELKPTGVQCSLIDNVSDAIGLLKEQKVSCIFLDILLNDTSSEEVLKFLKSEENSLNADVPVIIMSAYIDKDFVERNSNKVYRIIEKPFDAGEIADLVSGLNQAA